MATRTSLSFILILSIHLSTAQDNQWTWVDGADTINNYGDYPILRNPGSRDGSATWTDTSGNFWLFGGFGIGASSGTGRLNDLWKYNPSTNQWTWMTGGSSTYQHGSYGTQGTAAASNTPGARQGSASWIDTSGNLWLFGGFGYATSGSWGYLNDLWKYDPSNNQWTWIKGSSSLDQNGTYGTQGTAAASNTPGARDGSVTWTDASGDFWLFGGGGYGSSGSNGYLNDLWKYSPSTNQWTWVKGSNSINQNGTYGTQGTAAASNTPGGRYDAVSWTDASGNFWLHGGYGRAASSSLGYLNDLWKYNPSTNQWIWIKGSSGIDQNGTYGTQGTAAATNIPGARNGSVAWADTSGILWLFGGYGYPYTSSNYGVLNDLWKYDTLTNQWTWMKGNGGWNQNGTYGTQGTASGSNTPGGRDGSAAWIDASGNLWLFGGYGLPASGSTNGDLNDFWKYNPSTNQWTWIKGSNSTYQNGRYGKQASDHGQPGPRYFPANWTDSLGDLWLFGGHGYARHTSWTGKLDDLWKYNPSTNQWIWMKGSSEVNQGGTYGTQGTAAASNTPGGRSGSVTWIDTLGNFWLFGGNSNSGLQNDLWRYDPSTSQWTWMKGSNSTNQNGTYGTQGTAAASNTPGARYELVSWTDASGNFWLFGGYGYAASGSSGYLNDLWKYDPSTNQWTWVKGSSSTNQNGTYGTQGLAASSNTPSGRMGSVTWIDTLGNFWLFGGLKSGGDLNDLWKYDPSINQWTWMKGSNSIDQNGTYGIQGTAAASNTPGARRGSVSWTDASGNFWLFGGLGYPAIGSNHYRLNDLWKYYPSTNQWTWMKGSSSSSNLNGSYGTQGTAAISNTPGGREGSAVWTDTSGNFWLFGGVGYAASGGDGYLSDLWRYQGDTCNAPIAPSNTTSSSNLIICAGDSTTLSASGSGNLIWYATDTSTTALDSGTTFTTPTLTDTTTYFVESYTCTGSARTGITVIVNPLPVLSINSSASSDTVCNGDSLTLTASGGYNYTWSGGVVNGVAFIPSVSETYSVTATSGEGCTALDSVFISVAPLPIVSLTVTDVNCFGENSGDASASVTSGTTPYSYTWSNNATSVMINGLIAGTYSITVTDSVGCMVEDSVTLTQPDLLVLTQNSLSNVKCFGGNDGNASVLATGGTPGYSYLWTTGATVSNISNVTAGTYTVTVSDANSCTKTSSMVINQPQMLNANITSTNEVCVGEMNGSITVTVIGGTQPYAYLWNNSQVSSTLINLQPGSYTVTITDANDCESIKSATINSGNPLPAPDLGADTTITNGQAITLNAGTFDSYNWQDGSSAQTFTAIVSGTYWVEAFDADGCMGTDTINITIWPTGITESLRSSISIYPNPTHDHVQVKVEGFQGIIHLRLENAMGQVISTTSISGNSIHEVELGAASGVYILCCIDSNGNSSSYRIIKR